MQDGHKGHLGTIGVPEGVCGVVDEAAVKMYLSVRSTVLPVHVAKDGRDKHRVVEGGIEYGLGIGVRRFQADLSELLVPSLACFADSGLEIPSVQFGLHVQPCILFADRRDGHLHHDLFPFTCLEIRPTIVG